MKFIREAWGLNQTQMGKYLGMCRQNIYAWENRTFTTDRESQSKISERLGVPWARLSTERLYDAPPRPLILEPISVLLEPTDTGQAEIRTYKAGQRYEKHQSADATEIGGQVQKALKAGKGVWVIIR
jgi:DNA-binding XRE family transcriptional regulator